MVGTLECIHILQKTKKLEGIVLYLFMLESGGIHALGIEQKHPPKSIPILVVKL